MASRETELTLLVTRRPGQSDENLDKGVRDVRIDTSLDVIEVLGETPNQVRKGDIDPRVANSVGILLNILLRALERGELEVRMARLELMLKIDDRRPGREYDVLLGTEVARQT
jgi:hypothetical protein